MDELLTYDDPQHALHQSQPLQPPPHHPLMLYPPLPRRDGVSLQAQALGPSGGAARVRRLACEQVEVDGGLGAAGVDERLGRVGVFRGGCLEGDGRDGGQLAVVRDAPVRGAVCVCNGGRRGGLCREDRIVKVQGCGHSAASKLGRAGGEARETGVGTRGW